jgi:hypothetical protein
MYILNFLLALPLFIKNNDLPCCVNCIHFIESENNYPYDPIPDNNNFGKCKLFGIKNMVTCKIDNEYASVCREDENKCGRSGKYFQEKDNFEVIPSIQPFNPPLNPPFKKVEPNVESKMVFNLYSNMELKMEVKV